MNKLKRLIPRNKKTNAVHTGNMGIVIGAICFLLAHFDVVSADKLTPEAVAAIVTVFSALAVAWRQWIRP